MSMPLMRLSPARTAVVYAKLAMAATAWGGTFIAGRILAAVDPMFSACLRFILASLALFIFLLLTGKGFKKPTARQALIAALLGFCGIFSYSFFFFTGLQHISASRAALIVALNPAVMAVISYAAYRERVTPVKISGIVLCFCGVAIVVGGKGGPAPPDGSGMWLGEALIGGCVLSWSAYSVFCKTIVRELGPLHTVTYSIFAGTAMLLAFTAASGAFSLAAIQAINIREFYSLAYLGIIGSAVAYIWYYDGIQRIGATRSGIFIALNPFVAVLLGAAFLGESVSLAVMIGGALIITGIIAGNWER